MIVLPAGLILREVIYCEKDLLMLCSVITSKTASKKLKEKDIQNRWQRKISKILEIRDPIIVPPQSHHNHSHFHMPEDSHCRTPLYQLKDRPYPVTCINTEVDKVYLYDKDKLESWEWTCLSGNIESLNM
jgi:hypothetical protein